MQIESNVVSERRLDKISIAILLILTSCGKATAVRNDTHDQMLVDILYKTGLPRDLSPQAVKSGESFTAPICWRDVKLIAVGEDVNHLSMIDPGKVCHGNGCNCIVYASRIPRS